MRLEPSVGTNRFGRSGFLMHGDSIEARGSASRGCIILPRTIRELVWQSGDTVLEVVAEFQTRDQDLPEPQVRSRRSRRKIGIRKSYA